jgi:hypothetical protein
MIVLGAGLSLACLGRGWINPEAEGFIPHYLSDRPLLSLIFDPTRTDWENFQGRELSYLFDWVDCQFILLCTRAGLPHFISLTHLTLVAAIAVLLFRFARRDCTLPASVALAMVAVWLSSPAALLGANFYRSAKIASATALLVMLTAAWRGRSSGTGLLTVGLAGLAAALCDRQGFVLLLFFAVWLGWRALVWKETPALRFGLVAAGALAVAHCYTVFLAPRLIAHYTGRLPNVAFMQLSWSSLLTDAAQLKAVLVYAPLSALQSLGFQFGNLPPVILGVLLIVAAFSLHPPLKTAFSTPPWRSAALWWLAILLAVVVLNMGMALRQANVVILAEFKRIYFPLPATVWFFASVAVALRAIVWRNWLPTPVVAVVLAVIALSNLVSNPGHRLTYDGGAYAAQIKAGPDHLARLQRGDQTADPSPAVQALRRHAWPATPASPPPSVGTP